MVLLLRGVMMLFSITTSAIGFPKGKLSDHKKSVASQAVVAEGEA